MPELRGIEPHGDLSAAQTNSSHNCAISKQNKTLGPTVATDEKQICAHSEHNRDRSLRPKGVPAKYGIPQDLAMVIEAWERLPDSIKANIVAIVDEAAFHSYE